MTFSWLNINFAHGMRNHWSNCLITLELLSTVTAQFHWLKCWYDLLGCVLQSHSGIVFLGFCVLHFGGSFVQVGFISHDFFFFSPRGVPGRALDTCCMFHAFLLIDVEPGGATSRHCVPLWNWKHPAGRTFVLAFFGSISSRALMKTGGISSSSLIGMCPSCSVSCRLSSPTLSLFV